MHNWRASREWEGDTFPALEHKSVFEQAFLPENTS